MTTYSLRLAIAIAAALIPGLAWAQYEARQPAAPQAPSAELTACLRVQPVIENIIRAATARAEADRLSNSPSALRAAVDYLEAALRDIRAQLEPCSAATAATDPHAGHTMPEIPPPPGVAVPGATMDHSKMPMGGAPAGKPRAVPGRKPAAPAAPMDHTKMPTGGVAPGAKPGAVSGAKPATSAASKDPSKMPMGGDAAPGTVRDPVNGLKVDRSIAPKTTYQGQTYYFSSEQSRKEFLENPAKFAKKPKG